MYTPAAFSVEERSEVLGFLRGTPFGHLVTGAAPGGASTLSATALPFVVDDDVTTARAHFARANGHWSSVDQCHGLLIVPGADSYVSPRWYPSKDDHGKVVPTWNYELVHLHGTLEIHDDQDWKLALVSEMTDHNERQVAADPDNPWRVADAPDDFIEQQLRAIVGVQLTITSVDAKRKLSQNRPDKDRLGVEAGLSTSQRRRDHDTAALMKSRHHLS